MASLIDRIISAHGGRSRWGRVSEIMACVTMGGLDFTSRLHPRPLRDVEVTASAFEPYLTFTPYPRQGMIGFYTPHRVWIEDESGQSLAERDEPGQVFRSVKRWLAWDDLDILYYAGLVLWQTLNLPFILLRPELTAEELTPQLVGAHRWHRLNAHFPANYAALAPDQIMYSDAAGLVRRLDFASMYGTWLGLTQLCESHESFSGLVYPTRQTLHPTLLNGQVWRAAPLVWLELEDISAAHRPNADYDDPDARAPEHVG